MKRTASRLADEARPFRPRAKGGMPSIGWLEATVYGLALLGIANLVIMVLP